MKIAVSGANGFLGSIIARRLYKDGYEVHALMRENSSDRFIAKNCTHLHKLSYDDDSSILEIFNQVDVFIHVAALASDWGPYESFHKTNVDLAKKMHQLAIKSKVSKSIHISSNAVLGEEDNKTAKSENFPYNAKLNYFLEELLPSGMNNYKITKELGEKEVALVHKNSDSNLTILRPVWIFGPREFNAGPYEYTKTILEGIPCMPGSNENLFHTIYVEDVAEAVVRTIKHAPEGINIYNIGPKEVKTMTSFYEYFCHFVKKKKPLNLPYGLLLIPVTLLELIYLIFKIKTPPLLTRARLYMMYANNVYDVSKAETELGFVADTDIKQAVRKTVKWWKLNNFL